MLRRVALVFLRSVRRLLVAACTVPSSRILVTLMEAPGSSETSVLTRATRRNIPEDTILRIIVFVGGPKKESLIRGNGRCGTYIAFVLEQQQLNSRSGKLMHPGTIHRGSTF
jgi:hypothetical protein